MATRQLSDLRADVRQTVDLVNNTTWITDAEVDRRINESLARLYGRLVQARGSDYYRTSATDTTAAGTATLALPATMLSLLGIDVQIGSETFDAVPIGFEYRNRFQNNVSGWTSHERVYYSLESGSVRFFPTPQATHTVTFWYIPNFLALSLDTDTFEGFNGWEHWAVVDAAIQILAREESDTAALVFERDQIDREIQAMAAFRDRAAPPRVRDTRQRMMRRRGWQDWVD